MNQYSLADFMQIERCIMVAGIRKLVKLYKIFLER